MSGALFIVSSPSGGGKTSLVKALLEAEPDAWDSCLENVSIRAALPSSVATAPRRCSGARWAYRCVMIGVECPRIFPTSYSGTPAATIHDAAVCRSV